MFQSIGVKAGQPPCCYCDSKAAGGRFLLFRDGKEDKVSGYNETVTVKLGENFALTEHHGSLLRLFPLPKPLTNTAGSSASILTRVPFGGEETSRYAIVLILNGDVGSSNPIPTSTRNYRRVIRRINESSSSSNRPLSSPRIPSLRKLPAVERRLLFPLQPQSSCSIGSSVRELLANQSKYDGSPEAPGQLNRTPTL